MDLDLLSDSECKAMFRFTAAEIRRLLPFCRFDLLPRPPSRARQYNMAGETRLALFLFRCAAPHTWRECVGKFGTSDTRLSAVFIETAVHLHRMWSANLDWDARWLTPARLHGFAQAIEEEDGDGTLWGWVDGTTRPCSRPHDSQREWYNGHKRLHGFRHQGILTPDGLIASCSAAYVGCRQDAGLLAEVGLEGRLRALWRDLPAEDHLYLYGDKGYGQSHYGIKASYKAGKGQVLSTAQRAENRWHAGHRIEVEHCFGHVSNLFTAFDFKRQIRIGKAPWPACYIACVALTNARSCLDGCNQTSIRYDLRPPSFEAYMASL